MSKLLRYYKQGQVYFVTTVTYGRAPILIDNFSLLWESVEQVRADTGFELNAWVVMPDHLHLLIDPQESDLPHIMKRVKLLFSSKYRKRHNLYRATIWQRRFWDHIIRDEEDWRRHVDYIHYNPVKHEHVETPQGWKHSSMKEYLEMYSEDWGVNKELRFDETYGE